ncbi:MAG: M15 family metallopeptidase [Reinekea sp.]|nr:M15 family metallopeptidase [Reinekea sp.]
MNPIRKTSLLVTAILTFCLFSTSSFAEPEHCHYATYQWNVNEKRAVNYREVVKPYSEVTALERDEQTGCSVCEEDQQWVQVGDLPPVRLCKRFARDVEVSLNQLLETGHPIWKLVGYRVGMTRGELDANGNRTDFSNHSFGIALDINDEQNGLYDQCITYSDQCRLRKGGAWSAEQEGSLTADNEIVLRMKALGFRWGGEIAGRQKDFMHFSPTGY